MSQEDRASRVAYRQRRRPTLHSGPGARPTRRALRFAEAPLLAHEAPLRANNSRQGSLRGRSSEQVEQIEPAGKADFGWRRRRVQPQPSHDAARPLPADKVTQTVADQPVSASEHRDHEVAVRARIRGSHERGTAFPQAQHHCVHPRRRSKVGAVEAVHQCGFEPGLEQCRDERSARSTLVCAKSPARAPRSAPPCSNRRRTRRAARPAAITPDPNRNRRAHRSGRDRNPARPAAGGDGTRSGLPQRYALYLGGFEPRKIIARLVEAYALVPTAVQDGCALVLAGNSQREQPTVEALASRPGIRHRLVVPGVIAENDKPALLSAAHAFAFPSLYEGFGLPPLEAMACGTPVLVSNVSSLPEIVGDAAVLVSPTDVSGIASGLEQLISDDELRADLQQAAQSGQGGMPGRSLRAAFWMSTARSGVEQQRSSWPLLRRPKRSRHGRQSLDPTVCAHSQLLAWRFGEIDSD
jgi:glycosyltransferase involved in cell wall biosynthesis